jgi:hypothetical protein
MERGNGEAGVAAAATARRTPRRIPVIFTRRLTITPLELLVTVGRRLTTR